MEVSFVSLLSCNQLGWRDEQWGGGHITPTLPTLRIPSSLWRVLHPCLLFVSCPKWVIILYITLQCRHTETPGVRLVSICNRSPSFWYTTPQFRIPCTKYNVTSSVKFFTKFKTYKQIRRKVLIFSSLNVVLGRHTASASRLYMLTSVDTPPSQTWHTHVFNFLSV